MTAITWVGDHLSRVVQARPVELLVVLSLVFLLAALVLRWETRTRELRLLLAGLTLLALSAVLFLSRRPGFACLAGIAGAVMLLRGGWLELPSAPRASHFLLLIPVALGVALRFYAIAQVPEGVGMHAVGHHLTSAIRYKETLLPRLQPGHYLQAAKMTGSILMEDHFGFMSILAAIGFEGLGVGFLSARLLSALAGTLTVAVAYFMGRALEDERTGLLFAFLIAISPWHLTVSRYSDLEHVLCPLQLVLALGLYGAAIRTGRLAYYALAAVALGFSWYVYAPNQVLPLALALHLGAMLALRRGFFRRDWWKLGVFALLFLAVAGGPIMALVRGHRLNTVGYQGVAIPFRDVSRHGRMLVAAGRQFFVEVNDPWFGKPGGGLSLTEATLLLPGLLLYAGGLLRPTRRWTSALLLVLVPISLIPGVLALDESFRRFYPTATLALFIAATVLSRSIEAVRRIGLPPRAMAGAGLTFLIALTAVNTDIYFNKSRIGAEEGSIFLSEMAKCVKESFGKEFVYVCGPPGPAYERDDYYYSIRFATYHEQRELERQGGGTEDRFRVIVPGELLWVLPDPQSINGRTRFLAGEELLRRVPNGVNIQAAICATYPNAEEEVYRDRRGGIVLRSWRVSRSVTPPTPDRSTPDRSGGSLRRNQARSSPRASGGGPPLGAAGVAENPVAVNATSASAYLSRKSTQSVWSPLMLSPPSSTESVSFERPPTGTLNEAAFIPPLSSELVKRTLSPSAILHTMEPPLLKNPSTPHAPENVLNFRGKETSILEIACVPIPERYDSPAIVSGPPITLRSS